MAVHKSSGEFTVSPGASYCVENNDLLVVIAKKETMDQVIGKGV